mmetsp:Transcript_32611/g.85988  ORF Transcript_32611/g.85988 Transcript_32611/m.85988 type:complete len:286 (-) Transcript_32611:1075-1932(-)
MSTHAVCSLCRAASRPDLSATSSDWRAMILHMQSTSTLMGARVWRVEWAAERRRRGMAGHGVLLCSPLDYLARYLSHRDGHRVHTDTALAVGCRVEQRRLHRDQIRREHRVVMHDIERKRVVGVAIRQREEVSPANEEVAVEVGDAEAPCAADAHDSLEAGRAQQAPLELGLELDAVAARVEGGVVLEGARSVLGQARERRHIRVLRGEEEKVDADLEARELNGLGLVPLLARVEHDVLLVRTQRAWVLAVLESRLADARQVAQEHHHLTADVALDAVGCDEGGA